MAIESERRMSGYEELAAYFAEQRAVEEAEAAEMAVEAEAAGRTVQQVKWDRLRVQRRAEIVALEAEKAVRAQERVVARGEDPRERVRRALAEHEAQRLEAAKQKQREEDAQRAFWRSLGQQGWHG
jgi:hypothetical protein